MTTITELVPIALRRSYNALVTCYVSSKAHTDGGLHTVTFDTFVLPEKKRSSCGEAPHGAPSTSSKKGSRKLRHLAAIDVTVPACKADDEYAIVRRAARRGVAPRPSFWEWEADQVTTPLADAVIEWAPRVPETSPDTSGSADTFEEGVKVPCAAYTGLTRVADLRGEFRVLFEGRAQRSARGPVDPFREGVKGEAK